MKIALGQFDALVGGLDANVEKMRFFCEKALEKDAQLIVFPELAISGYPPEDLLLKSHFYADCLVALESLAIKCPALPILVGFPNYYQQKTYNAMAFLRDGRIQEIYRKCLLPNYGVFDEQRYFTSGCQPIVISLQNKRLALTICEDIWDADWLAQFLAPVKPIDCIINISASPFHVGKIETRRCVLTLAVKRLTAAVAYCNLVGGQDELVFDGRSMIVNAQGNLVAQALAFKEDMLIADLDARSSQPPAELSPEEEVYQALLLGTRDYVLKNRFKRVVIGLSGGIDSALTAAIAVDALGAENVVGITMPSKFNSSQTIGDAELVAKNLGIEFRTISIGPTLESFDKTLSAVGGWNAKGLAYENLQARIRGSILMSLSNQFGWLVLTTGNKSETAVGYSTLYGDTAGGFAVIKDVPKTLVYKLCTYINLTKGSSVIPQSVIDRAPSAELRPDQKDADSLPDYDLLDTILKGYVEDDKSTRQLVASGLPAEVVQRVAGLIDRNEYKRRQSPPGIKITPKAFGKDWRLPITNAYGSKSPR